MTCTRCIPRAFPSEPDNPHGNAFRSVATHLRSEQQAQRLIDPLAARYWRVENPTVRNALGEPVAYKLLPGTNVVPFRGGRTPAPCNGRGSSRSTCGRLRSGPASATPPANTPTSTSGGTA